MLSRKSYLLLLTKHERVNQLSPVQSCRNSSYQTTNVITHGFNTTCQSYRVACTGHGGILGLETPSQQGWIFSPPIRTRACVNNVQKPMDNVRGPSRKFRRLYFFRFQSIFVPLYLLSIYYYLS